MNRAKSVNEIDPNFVVARLAIEIGAWRVAHADTWGASQMAQYLVDGVLTEPDVLSCLVARVDIEA